jgi:integrase
MLELAKSGEGGTTKFLELKIRDFIIWLREDVKRSQSTVMTYSAAISHFYQMNDVIINWKKLKKFKGKMRNVVQDVPYTREQIKKLIDGATLRNSCIILLMSSAGLRRGAIPNLQLQDLEKIAKYDLYKITVYRQEKEEYITYCTPECTKLIDEYLEWRVRLGEVIKPITPLFRREFDTTSPMQIARVKPLVTKTISTMIASLADRTGVRPRTKLPYSKTSLMQCHGFRKFFDTQCISHNMNPLYCEYLMGHKSGLIKSYFKPTDMELLEGNDKSVGYIGVIPYLTINATEEENERLRRQVETLQVEKSQIEDLQKEMNAIRELVAVKTKASNTYEQ